MVEVGSGVVVPDGEDIGVGVAESLSIRGDGVGERLASAETSFCGVGVP